MAGGGATGVDLSRKFVSEAELDEKRKKRQEEWEKVRKPDDPEEVPEEEYDPRSLYERLQEQKDKKQEEYEEQFKFNPGSSVSSLPSVEEAGEDGEGATTISGSDSPESDGEEEEERDLSCSSLEESDSITTSKASLTFLELGLLLSHQKANRTAGNMVRGLDEDETSFLDEVSRQQCLVEKQRRDEEKQELLEYRSALVKQASTESRKEPEKKAATKHSGTEQRTSHLSQAHLLAGAVKRRSSSQSSDNSKKQKAEITTTATTGNGERHTEQEDGAGGGGEGGAEDQQTVPGLTAKTPSAPLSSGQGVLHLPSAAVCVGVLPGLWVYSGSSDSDSSSDSEGSVDAIMLPYPRLSRAYR